MNAGASCQESAAWCSTGATLARGGGGPKILQCADQKLILNLKATLESCKGRCKRDVGDLEVLEDLTLASANI